jgi:putative MATE family efflux protein
VTVGVLGFLLTDPMLSALPSSPGTGADVIPLAGEYMEVFFLGLPFLFGFFVISALMRGYGNTRAPMVVMGVSVLINVVIDPILIFGWFGAPALGVQGAALATIVSRGVATVMGIYILFGTSAGPSVSLADFRPKLEYVAQIVRIGVPSAVEQSATALGFITLTVMVISFAPEVVAAYGLGNRLTSLIFLPALGLGRATNTIVGQNLGARKPERAERAVYLAASVGAGVMVVAGVVAHFFAEPIVSIFVGTTGADAEATVRFSVEYVRIWAVEFGFIGVLQVVLGAYRGAGNTKTALAFSLVALWLGRVPIVYLLSFEYGFAETGIWIGMAAGQIIGAILAAAWFTRGTWKQSVIDADGDRSDEAEAGVDESAGEAEEADDPAP